MESQPLYPEISKETFRLIFKKSQTPSFIWKKMGDDLVLIDYNEEAYSITNGAIKDVLGVKARVYYSDRSQIIEDLNRCLNDKTSF